MTSGSVCGPRILMLLGNNEFPQDERVRREARSLVEAGYRVAVIAPRAAGQASREWVNGVLTYRYWRNITPRTGIGYFLEYAITMTMTTVLVIRDLIDHDFDAIHAHNPPDIFVMICAPLRMILGKKYVFDFHDLTPELYEARFQGRARSSISSALALLVRLSCKLSDHVLATNESYERAAQKYAGHLSPKTTVVRNGPDAAELAPVQAQDEEELRRGVTRIGYLGVMGYQDGIDHLLRAVSYFITDLGRADVEVVLIGDGDAREDLERYAAKLGLKEYVRFTGYLESADWRPLLASMDICVVPDPSNSYTDRSTIVKLMDYMALSKPTVGFDLAESRVTAKDAALLVRPNDDRAFAQGLAELIDDPLRCRAMGAYGRRRVESELAWEISARRLVGVYDRLLGPPAGSQRQARRIGLRRGGVELVQDERSALSLWSDWDRLASEAGRPFSAPSWCLSWWLHAAPLDVELAVCVVEEKGRVVGLGPFCISHRAGVRIVRPLAYDAGVGIEPLCTPGREREVGHRIATALAGASGATIVELPGVPVQSPWPGVLAEGMGGAVLSTSRTMLSPFVHLGGRSFEDWRASRGRHFRKRMAAGKRRLGDAGGVFRLSGPAEVEADLRAFADLHYERWGRRGGSRRLYPSLEQTVMASARHLVPQGRLRVWSLEIGGQIVASEVFLAAGGHVSAWLGGFDGASERLSPSLQLILRALEDGFERGDERLDLGPSDRPDFKARFTESAERLAWVTIRPRGSGRWRGRAVAAAIAAPHRVGERLSPEQKSAIRKVVPRI